MIENQFFYVAGLFAGPLDLLEATGLAALLVVGLTLVVAWRLGELGVSWLVGSAGARGLERVLLSVALGLGVIAYLTFAAAALGLLHRWLFRGAFVIGLVLAAFELGRRWRTRTQEPGERRAAWRSWLVWTVGVTLGLVALICLVAALGPETEFDALNHHLGTVRLYVREGGFFRTPSMAWSSHPFTVQMLFAASWLVYGPLATKLMHFALGMLAAASCFVFCRRYVSTGAGVLAALLFLGCPMVTYLTATAYVDLGLALFAMLSLHACYRWLESGRRSWALLAGIFAGLALGSKYFGGTVVAACSVALWLVAWRGRKTAPGRVRLTDYALYLAVALAVFSPWLVKNYVLVGNPVSPFLADVIPTLDFSARHYREFAQYSASWKGYSGGLLDYLKTPWFLTFRPDLFDGSVGPAYFLLFPFALALGWKRPAIRFALVCALVGFVFQVAATRNVRYYVVLFPWLSVAIAGALWPAQRESGRLNVRLRQALVLAAVALVILQLPWFAPLWPGPAVLTLSPDRIRLFSSEAQREEFFESRCLGPRGGQLYTYLDGLAPKSGILALTPVYQSLTDQTVFMAPNSSVATDLSFLAIDLAQREQGLDTAKLALESRAVRRFWRVDLRASVPLPMDETQPRLFIVEKGVTIEVGGYSVRREQAADMTAVIIDLGRPRKVDLITFVSERRERPTAYRLWEADQEGQWTEAQGRLSLENPRRVTIDEFLAACSRYGVSYVILGHHPGALFLLDYFLDHPDRRMRYVKGIGGYEIIELAQPSHPRQLTTDD